MVRFSPPAEFPDNSVRVAAGSFMKRSSSVSKRFLIAARSAFERGEVSQTLRDIIALLFAALFVIVTGLGVVFSIFILICVRC